MCYLQRLSVRESQEDSSYVFVKGELPAFRVKPQRLSVRLQRCCSGPVHVTLEESPVILDLCLRELDQENHVIIVTQSLSKSSVFKTLSSTRERNIRIFKFLRFELRAFSKSSVFVTDYCGVFQTKQRLGVTCDHRQSICPRGP